MIREMVADGLLARLAALDWYPKENPSGIEDLRAAINLAQSEFIATSVVDDWIQNQRQAPKPSDLRQLVWAENEKRAEVVREREQKTAERRPFTGCGKCHGFGYHGGFIGTNHDGPWLLCHCRAGDERAQKLVDEGNWAREILLRKFGAKNPKYMATQVAKKLEPPLEDDYKGEF